MAANNNHDCSTFKAPSSLKELLDFYDKLETTDADSAEEAVLLEIQGRLKGGNKDGWVNNADLFYKQNFFDGNTGAMWFSIQGLKALRKNILSNGTNDTYTLPSNGTSDPCVKKYADAIIQNAFPLFGCLYYLWFMCVDGDDESGKKIKNGNNLWETEKVKNGSSSNSLKQFLKDEQPTKNQNSVPMLTRGFKDAKLHSSHTGSALFNTNGAKTLFSLMCADSARLQQALYFLLFLAPRWHPAMSGHALLFVDWFNHNASQAPFHDVQWLHVKGAGQEYFKKDCKGNGLEDAIKQLAEGGDSGPNISPVHTNSKNGKGTNGNNLYSNNGQTILHNSTSLTGNDKKAHVFMQYVSWLWWCIPQLTESLKEMEQDSKNWNNKGESFKNSTSFGPFAFGFTFTNKDWQNGNGEQLKGKLSELISGIEQFKCCIEAFFWAIRRPFACGSLAAWIVSLTFLLYVHFMPLDIFHLKSHLLASSSFYRSDVIHSTLISNVTDVSYFKIL